MNNRQTVQVRYNLTGKAPIVAVVSLLLSFLIGAVALFFADTEYGWTFDFFVLGPLTICGLSCSLVFLRVLLGAFDTVMNWSLIVAVAIGCYGVADEWYVVVLISAMAYAIMLIAVHSLVGSSAQIVRVIRQKSEHIG